jgi:uncharacterized protein (DUF427 family)
MARDQTRPAADGITAGHFTGSPVQAGHTAPNPRRIRATLGGRTVVDTRRSTYVWDHPHYPRWSFPAEDVDAAAFPERVVRADRRLVGHVRIPWDAADAWFEEDEQVVGHPRSPYVRVDALRSSRRVEVVVAGTVVARSARPVALVETGLPIRWYLDPIDVDHTALIPSDTRTLCPYKGPTTGYWSVRVGDVLVEDAAWSYATTTAAVAPIAGLIAFLDEAVEVRVDGVPTTGDEA